MTLQLAPECRRLGVEHVRLVRLGRQIDGSTESGLALAPAGQSELAGDGRTVVDEVDLDRHPRPDPGVASSRGPAPPSSGDRAAATGAASDPSAPATRPIVARARATRREGRLGTRRQMGDDARALRLRVRVGLVAAWTPRVGRKLHGRGRSAGGYRTMRRSHEPSASAPSFLRVPCPRSAPSGHCATTPRRSAIPPWSSPRRMT